MNQTTKETRRRSYDAVLPKRAARCRLILETLGNRELTASEITEELVSPHQPGDGGILTMPLRDNVPEPPTDDWQPTTCPVCGAECWQTDTARRILALEPDVRTACTACALKGLGK